jgi:hypothetical protein
MLYGGVIVGQQSIRREQMQIQKMILTAQAAVDLGEVPTVEQMMCLATALHAMTVRMPEFLCFSQTFENMREIVYNAGCRSALLHDVSP